MKNLAILLATISLLVSCGKSDSAANDTGKGGSIDPQPKPLDPKPVEPKPVDSAPDYSCIASVDRAIQAASNTAAAGGYRGSLQDIQNEMKIAMSKASCYNEKNPSKICEIKLKAMFDTGKGAAASGGTRVSDGYLMQIAHQISGC